MTSSFSASSDTSLESVSLSNESSSVVSLDFSKEEEKFEISDLEEEYHEALIELDTDNYLYSLTPSSETSSAYSFQSVPAPPPPSSTNSSSTFITQLNNFNWSLDDNIEDGPLEFIKDFHGIDDNQSEAENEEESKGSQMFLTYFIIPALLSHLLLFVIITCSSSEPSASVIHPTIRTIHYYHQHHHHHHHHHYYYYEKNDNNGGAYTRRFFYILFNPFSVVYNSKIYRLSLDWITAQANDPTTLIGQLLKYLNIFKLTIKSKLEKCSGHGNLFDNRSVGIELYDKGSKAIQNLKETFTIKNITNWTTSTWDRLFSKN